MLNINELASAGQELDEANQMVIDAKGKITSIILEDVDEALNYGLVKIDYAMIAKQRNRVFYHR